MKGMSNQQTKQHAKMSWQLSTDKHNDTRAERLKLKHSQSVYVYIHVFYTYVTFDTTLWLPACAEHNWHTLTEASPVH